MYRKAKQMRHEGLRNRLVFSTVAVLAVTAIGSASPPRSAIAGAERLATVSPGPWVPTSSVLVNQVGVWAATNQLSHGDLKPITGSGSTLDVEVGDLLNSFGTTSKGPLGLATASDGEGSSQAFVVSPSTSQVFSLAGSFTNLDGSAVLPDDHWGYLADQGFSESASLDVVNLQTREVYPITSLPGFSPALSAVAACTGGNIVVATDNGDNELDIFSGVGTDPTNPTQTTVPVGSDPVAVACSRGLAYVADEESSTLTVVDVATASVSSTISVGASPDAVSVSSKRIYVANRGSDNLSIIRVGSTSVAKTVAVGVSPDGIAQSGDVYVTDYASDAVTVLSPGGSLVNTFVGIPSPEAISVVQA